MSDYEQIVVSAIRYALGRCTYIVDVTVDYVIKDIDNNKLSKNCLNLIYNDILDCKDYGWECDKSRWIELLNKVKGVLI